ncbi:hypothetical protein [Saccharopolyspora phatthalungensis]|uniref:Uncharacterized protein n=1 Tax=Saccharopolyspora phatthalungensis TaxID=664693 RepID=A0A840PZB5_9PSEU|nr:hypothetical protein [Saccharopolyspora phatthalungensis]MBB5155622.1 hypothetical protein [Saccharopolyspora phatthalungensis]
MTTVSLAEWTPGLDDAITLGEAYDAMPGDDASAIPWYVRLLENPWSPLALPGAIDLFGHDCVHILLGRGALPSDEAFVLGVTMGASGRLKPWQQVLYALATQHLYRAPFRFTRSDLVIYDMAAEYGRNSKIKSLHHVPWPELRDRPLGDIRASLGVDATELMTVYQTERAMWPDSRAAQRLPSHAPRPY